MKRDTLVLGAGAWGTALANLLAENQGKKIYLWAYEKDVATSINTKRQNSSYLPKIKLNKNIVATSNFNNITARFIFVVVPSQFVYNIVKSYLEGIAKNNRNLEFGKLNI